MGEVTNDFLAEMLRRMQSDMSDLKLGLVEVKVRLGNVGKQVAQLFVSQAEMSARIDRLDGKMERVMRRLDLVEHSDQ